jgi:hypothetical protein
VKSEFDVALKDDFATQNRRLVSKQPDRMNKNKTELNIIDSEETDDDEEKQYANYTSDYKLTSLQGGNTF